MLSLPPVPTPALACTSSAASAARVLGTGAWRRTEFEFQVAEPADIILICELQATSGEALFDLTSLKIRRR